jgi:hypothetical protein
MFYFKRSRYSPPKEGFYSSIENRYFKIVKVFVLAEEKSNLDALFPSTVLWRLGMELSMKSINLSSVLQRELNCHPVLLPEGEVDLLSNTPISLKFDESFLRKVSGGEINLPKKLIYPPPSPLLL